MDMNLFFLALFILFIILVLLYVYSEEISEKIPRKSSVVLAEETDGCIFVPVSVTRYIVGRHTGINISVDGVLAANVKPGDTVSVPIRPGIRQISAYCHGTERHDIEAFIDENTMLFAYSKYDGLHATPFIERLEKNDDIDESLIEKEYLKMSGDIRSLKMSGLIRVFVILIPMFIAGIFLL